MDAKKKAWQKPVRIGFQQTENGGGGNALTRSSLRIYRGSPLITWTGSTAFRGVEVIATRRRRRGGRSRSYTGGTMASKDKPAIKKPPIGDRSLGFGDERGELSGARRRGASRSGGR